MKYRLQKNNPYKNLTESARNNLCDLGANFVFLVGYTATMGFVSFAINKALHVIPIVENYPMVIAAGTAVPLVILYKGMKYLAKEVYRNVRKEAKRVQKFSETLLVEKTQKLPSGFQTPEQMARIRDRQEFDRSEKVVDFENYQVPEPTLETEKRKTLNLYS